MSNSTTATTKSHHRRYAGYDYSKGASLFITVATEPRQFIFGSISESGVMFSPFGVIAEVALAEAEAYFAGITVVMRVIMPDHVHFRIVLAKGMPEPVRLIGAFVGRFKQFSQWHISQAGGPAHIGYVYISTFFSPGEHAAYRAVAEETTAPMINLRADAVEWGYRPKGMETTLFGAGRLMVVARMEATDDPAKRADLLWLNDVARLAAIGHGGKAVYVTADAAGRPVYQVEG